MSQDQLDAYRAFLIERGFSLDWAQMECATVSQQAPGTIKRIVENVTMIEDYINGRREAVS